MDTNNYGKKRPLWQWILIYIVVGGVIYGLVYYFFLRGTGEYSGEYGNQPSMPSMPSTYSPTTQQPTTQNPASAPTSQNPKAVAISIINFSFSPSTITVAKGTTVTWTNNDSVPHTVTGNSGGPDGQPVPNSQPIKPGESYSYTFDRSGPFYYHCSIHTNMMGLVQVGS